MTLAGHDHVVECITWAPDAVANSILGSTQQTADGRLGKMNGGEPEPQAVLVSGSRDRSVRVWDVFSATCLFVLTGHDNWVRGIRIHPSGKYLLSVSDDKTLRVWSIEHKRCTKVLPAHSQFVTSIDFHHKLPFVVTSSVDTTVKIWECR